MQDGLTLISRLGVALIALSFLMPVVCAMPTTELPPWSPPSIPPAPGSGTTNWYKTYYVFAPTARDSGGMEIFSSYDERAKKLDGYPAELIAKPGMEGFEGLEYTWMYAKDFTDTSYEPYWYPYTDRGTFPLTNATIMNVWITVVLYCVYGIHFKVNLKLGELNITTPTYWGMYDWHEYSYRITNATNWTPELLMDENLNVTLMLMNEDSGTLRILVDYIGIKYTYTYAETVPWTPSFNWGGIGIIPIIGAVGFIGMIVMPAVSIWMYRQSPDESKVGMFVKTIALMMICFVMFLVAIR